MQARLGWDKGEAVVGGIKTQPARCSTTWRARCRKCEAGMKWEAWALFEYSAQMRTRKQFHVTVHKTKGRACREEGGRGRGRGTKRECMQIRGERTCALCGGCVALALQRQCGIVLMLAHVAGESPRSAAVPGQWGEGARGGHPGDGQPGLLPAESGPGPVAAEPGTWPHSEALQNCVCNRPFGVCTDARSRGGTLSIAPLDVPCVCVMV
jgi:hypothetical protein